ncbi:uncharacterized protein G2W53_037128 [Senna tora]|uniref:Uncharacterized protein n=1 Tax=Senna tora TaxID=362788 RepID=A0A834SU56_9FABA|nr:uncharacterized protein G2W53_037128 [Senna tora]
MACVIGGYRKEEVREKRIPIQQGQGLALALACFYKYNYKALRRLSMAVTGEARLRVGIWKACC